MLKYLSRYTHRVAISNHRLLWAPFRSAYGALRSPPVARAGRRTRLPVALWAAHERTDRDATNCLARCQTRCAITADDTLAQMVAALFPS